MMFEIDWEVMMFVLLIMLMFGIFLIDILDDYKVIYVYLFYVFNIEEEIVIICKFYEGVIMEVFYG